MKSEVNQVKHASTIFLEESRNHNEDNCSFSVATRGRWSLNMRVERGVGGRATHDELRCLGSRCHGYGPMATQHCFHGVCGKLQSLAS